MTGILAIATRCPDCKHAYTKHIWGICMACPRVYGPPPPTGMCQQRRPVINAVAREVL